MLKRFDYRTPQVDAPALLTFSLEVKSWLELYVKSVELSFNNHRDSALPSDTLRANLTKLKFEISGDYAEQFEALQQLALDSIEPAEAENNLATIMLNYRRIMLLGKAAAGKTTQLLHLLHQTQNSLAQAVKTGEPAEISLGLASGNARLFFPVYLDLSEINTHIQFRHSESVTQQPDLFQDLLNQSLRQIVSEAAPANLFKELVPLVLVDNLEQFEPNLAPIFFYNLSQWLEQIAPNAHLVFGCRFLDFPLYHSWFRDGNEAWQFLALNDLSWANQRQLLASKIGDAKLTELEQTGLTGIFTNPALYHILQPHSWQLSNSRNLIDVLPILLDAVFGEHELSALYLARLSRLLSEDHKKLGPFDILPQSLLENISEQTQKHTDQVQNSFTTCLAKALAVGLVEKHAILNWTRFATPALDLLVTVWFCLQLPAVELTDVLNEVLSRLESKSHDEELRYFVNLLYLATSSSKRPALVAALLGNSPELRRLQLVFDLAQLDTNFLTSWQGYLKDILANSASVQAMLKLIVTLSKQTMQGKISNKANSARLALIEVSLETILASANQPDTEMLANLAQIQERLGNSEKAIQSYRQVTVRSSQLPFLEARLGLARLLNSAGEHFDAANYLYDLNTRLLNLQAEVNNLLSEVSRNSGNYENAINFARCAVQLDQNNATYQLNLALALHSNGYIEKAEQQLTKLVATHPNFPTAFYELGKLQLERGASELALPNLRRAVELSPNTGIYLYELGCSLATQAQYGQAYIYLEAALSEVKNEASYYQIFGLTALKLNRFDKALTAFESAQKLENTVSLLCLAATYYAKTDYEAAINSLKKALQLDKNNPLPQLLLGMVKEAQQNFKQATSYYLQATELIELSSAVQVALWLGLARTARLTHSLELAENYCEKAANLQPDALEVLLEQGKLAQAQQNYARAVALFARGLSLMAESEAKNTNNLTWPFAADNCLALFTQPESLEFELPLNYSIALAALNRLTEAQTTLENLLETLTRVTASDEQYNRFLINHYRVAVRYQLAVIFLKTQRSQAALKLLQQVVEAVPNSYSYRMALAKAWQANDNYETALQELKQACQLEPQNGEVYAEMAELYLLKNKTLAADQLLISLNSYLKALEIAPHNISYLYRATQLAYRLHQLNQTLELNSRMLAALEVQKTEDEILLFDAYLLAACIWENNGKLEKARTAIVQTLRGSVKGKATYLLVAARLARKANQPAQQKQALASVKERDKLPELLQAALFAEEAHLSFVEQRYAEAANLFQQAIQLHSQFLETGAALKLSEFYYEVPFFSDNTPAGKEAAAILAMYQIAYAEILYRLGLYPAALTNLKAVLAANPNLAQAYTQKAEILYAQTNYQAALEAINQALKLEPSAGNYYWLGLIQLKLENFALAVKAFEQIKAESNQVTEQPAYFLNFGQAYENLGDLAAARSTYNAGLLKAGTNSSLQQALARCYLKSGQHKEAIQPLQAAVLSDPNPANLLALAQLYEEIGWWSEAATQYERVNSLSPAIADSWFKLGRALLHTGRIQQGRANLEQALQLDANRSDFYYELGKSFLDSYQATQGQKYVLPADLDGMFSSSVINA